MMKCFIISAFIFWVSGCSDKKNKEGDILPKDKMQAVLWDVIKAEVYTQSFIKNNSAKNILAENMRLQQQVFCIHKISKDDFTKSYAYYKLHPDKMNVILDSITVKAERERGKLMMKKYSRTSID